VGLFLIAILNFMYIYIVTGILYILLKRSSQLGDLLMDKKRILYADDYVGFKDYFCRAADRLGHEPVFVDDAARAWELIRAGTHFDLIISDNDMLELTGIELLKLVRSNPATLETPVRDLFCK
jgi:CheY-like chemotaxis protein